MSYLPIFYNLQNKNILIVGGGNIALAKLETLILYSTNITIIANKINDGIQNLLLQFDAKDKVKIICDSYDISYLKDNSIIIAATGDEDINKQISEDGNKLNKIVNVVDNPSISNFIFPAIVKRKEFNIAISSSGLSPVLSRIFKQRIEKIIPNNIENLNDFIKENRELVKGKLQDLQARRLFWQEVIEGEISNQLLNGNKKFAKELLNKKLNDNDNLKKSFVYFIGVGPGDSDLITLKAIKLISRADIILYDRLVCKDILNYTRKDGIKINVGKSRKCHKYSQGEINNLIIDYAKKGNIVARVKGGDVTIFSHLTEELEVVRKNNIPYEIVPGVTSASAAAAYNGISLTKRNKVRAVRFLTLYKEDIICENYWRDLANTNDSLVFYMSSINVNLICEKLIKYGKSKNTKICLVEQATTKYQKSYFSIIEKFAEKFKEKTEFISPSIILLGEVATEEYRWLEEGNSGNYFN